MNSNHSFSSLNEINFNNKINVLKRKLSQNNINEEINAISDSINDCVYYLVNKTVDNYQEISSEENIATKIESNMNTICDNKKPEFDLNKLELSDDFWADFDFDLKNGDIDENEFKRESSEVTQNIGSNHINSFQNNFKQLLSKDQIKTEFVDIEDIECQKDNDFNKEIQLSLKEMSINWAKLAINGTKKGAEILTQLDSINDAILKMKQNVIQQRNTIRTKK